MFKKNNSKVGHNHQTFSDMKIPIFTERNRLVQNKQLALFP